MKKGGSKPKPQANGDSEAQPAPPRQPSARPTVRIERNWRGTYTYSVEVPNRESRHAVARAMEAFTELRAYVRRMEVADRRTAIHAVDQQLASDLERSVEKINGKNGKKSGNGEAKPSAPASEPAAEPSETPP